MCSGNIATYMQYRISTCRLTHVLAQAPANDSGVISAQLARTLTRALFSLYYIVLQIIHV